MDLIDAATPMPLVDSGPEHRAYMAPAASWRGSSASEHFVQIYHSDDVLIESVGEYLAAGLTDHETCLVFATPDHRSALTEALGSRGVDVASAVVRERLMLLDAAEILSSFMRMGEPDPSAFFATVGAIVARAAGNGRPIRAFGEMVALLWADGLQPAAVKLERLWNELAKDYTFSLYCAYPLHICEGQTLSAQFAEVCCEHARVIPAESYAALVTAEERLAEIARLQQKAQSLEAEVAHRRSVEEALRRREQELSDFFDNALESLHRVGPDGTILWANKAELNLLGYRAEEYVGHHIAEFHADETVIQDIVSRLVRGEELYDFPARLVCKDGSIREVLIHSNGCFEGGRLAHTRCFTRDVTERNRLQRAMDERLAEIEVLNASLQRAMTETHHRIKNNLQVISAMIDMQAMDYEAEQAVPLDQFIRLKTHIRMLAVVHDLLTQSVKEQEDAQRVSVKQVLERLILMLQESAWISDVTFEVEEALIPTKQCVSVALIVNELVSNAQKHGRGMAHVTLRVEADRAVLEVADNGPGFPPCFDPARAANTGLELIQAVVRTDLAGDIAFENGPQGGALVRVTLSILP
jgi:PAS domain S-box-containing protein